MNDAFWNSLPATITAIAACIAAVTGLLAAIFSFLNGWFSRKASRELKADLKENTVATVATVVGQQELGNKMDSATRSVKQDNLLVAQVAKTASNKVIEKINDMQNGGPGGLGELSKRVAQLEAGHAEVVRGQFDIVKSIDQLATAINRKQLS